MPRPRKSTYRGCPITIRTGNWGYWFCAGGLLFRTRDDAKDYIDFVRDRQKEQGDMTRETTTQPLSAYDEAQIRARDAEAKDRPGGYRTARFKMAGAAVDDRGALLAELDRTRALLRSTVKSFA